MSEKQAPPKKCNALREKKVVVRGESYTIKDWCLLPEGHQGDHKACESQWPEGYVYPSEWPPKGIS